MLTLARRPRLWAAGAEMRDIVTSGRASSDDAAPSWRAPTDIALLVPAPHRTIFRAGLASEPLDVSALPDPEAASRGWSAPLDRGLRTDLPEPWQTGVDAARADLLLEPPSAAVVAALEDWGFDAEAAAMWGHLSGRERRRAHKRATARDTTLATTRRPARTRRRDRCRTPSRFPARMAGSAVAVHDLPLRAGGLSYAVRWHGARPALLWDAPAGVPLRVPALDPDWRPRVGRGRRCSPNRPRRCSRWERPNGTVNRSTIRARSREVGMSQAQIRRLRRSGLEVVAA